MLRLLIDKKEVALSGDTTFEFYRENPLINNSGDYTFDVDINLKYRNNANVYSGIKRINNSYSVTDREAILMEGPVVICRGTEVILQMDGDIVKIQIVGGNSELNYVVANEDNIRDLDLGTIPTKTKAEIVADIDKCYPDVDVNYPPIFFQETDGGEVIANKPKVVSADIDFADDTQFRPQPFLLFYAEKIMEAIGYTVKENLLINNERWKRLLVINGYNTDEYSKMLPDWTTKSFVEELEKFLNCVFLVDSNKEVTITDASTYYDAHDRTYYFDEDVCDSYQRVYEDNDDTFLVSASGLSYKLPTSSLEWKLANVDKSIWKRVSIVEQEFNVVPVQTGWDGFTVYKDTTTGELYKTYRDAQTDGSVTWLTKGVNFYADYTEDEEGSNLSMSIIPAMITNIEQQVEAGGEIYTVTGGAMVPVTTYYEYNKDDSGFYENVTGDVEQNDVQDSLETAFYLGTVGVRMLPYIDQYYTERKMAMCATKRYHCMNNQLHGLKDGEITGYDSTWDLSPEARIKNEFGKSIQIKRKQKYVFHLRTKKLLDPKYIYQIRGKQFICIKLTYKWSNLIQDSYVEGEFYELK